MKRRFVIGMLAAILMAGKVTAQSPKSEEGPFTLEMCIELGLQQNISIKKALLDEEAADYQRKEILGSGLPQIDAYGNYHNFLEVFPQAIPGGVLNPASDPNGVDVIAFGVPQSMKAGFQVSQLVFSQSYLVGLKAAKSSEEFYHLLSEMTKEDIIYDIALNYYGVIATQLQMDNLQANFDKLKKLEEILKAQYENDLVRKVDYNRVKVNLTTLETQMDNLGIVVEQRLNYLKLIMGVPVNINLKLAPYDFSENLVSLSALQEDPDLNQRYDLQVLNKKLELNSLNIKNMQSGYYPTLAAFADVNYNAFSREFDFISESHSWHRGALIGLQLNVPIFDGLQKKNKIAQGRVEIEKVKYDQYMAEQNAQVEYLNAIQKLGNSIKSLEAQESNLALAETIFEETTQLYRQGLSPLTDLLDAETSLREARAAYYSQIINVKTAEADLLRSTGDIENII